MNLREQIFSAQDLKIEPAIIPEWGVTVWVKSWTALERYEWECWCEIGRESGTTRDSLDLMTKAVVLAVVDEAGKPVFDRADAETLKGKASRPVVDLFKIISRLNGLGQADLEDARKNSPGGPCAALPAGLPSNSDTRTLTNCSAG